MTTALRVLQVARGQLGTHETASGWTKYGAWYAKGYEHSQWCDMFVSWCAAQVGASPIVGKFAYTPYHARWFEQHGRWGHSPRIGAVVFYDWAGTRSIPAIDHVGLVESIRSNGDIVTLEGNTSNAVMRRVRSTRNVAGYGYPAYTGTNPVPKSQPTQPASTDWFGAIVTSLPTIKRGATGGHVRTVQGLLQARGQSIVIDGEFGPDTDARVKAFQSAAKITKDGVVGATTWRRLILG